MARIKDDSPIFVTYYCSECNFESGYTKDYKFKKKCKICGKVLEEKGEEQINN